jgi:Gpi18-like mannosyltransferase
MTTEPQDQPVNGAKLRSRWREEWAPHVRMVLWVLVVFVVSRGIVLVAAHAALRQPVGARDFMVPMFRWDAAWYAKITEQGYEYADDGVQHNIAFFPLYPWLTRLLVPLMPGEDDRPIWLAQTLLSHLGFLVGLFFVYGFTRRLGNESAAAWAICFVAFFPPAMFFSAGYPEGLFLALVSASGVALLRDRIVLAAGLIGLAAACRPTALAFVPTLLYCGWKRYGQTSGRFWRLTAVGLLSISGGVLFASFLAYRFGSPFVYTRNFEAWLDSHRLYDWGDMLVCQPWINRGEHFVKAWRDGPVDIRHVLEPAWLTLVWIPVILVISVNGLIFDRTALRKFYWIGIFLFLIPYVSSRGTPPTFEAIGRYLSVAYPVSAAMGLWIERGRWKPMAAMLLAVMAVLMAYAAYCFALPGGPFVG